jgi:predicted nucleic acid-binding Zn ribbon protein
MTQATCASCGAGFDSTHGNQRYCSDACRRDAWNGHRRAGYALRICDVCAAEYAPLRRDQRYCSEDCRTKAKRDHERARWRAVSGEAEHARKLRDRTRCRAWYQRRCLLRTADALAKWTPAPPALALNPGPAAECQRCGSPLTKRKHRYCTENCAAEATAEKQRQWNITHRPPPARAWVAGHCRECAEPFVVPRAGAKPVAFCSETCSRRNHRRRDKQKRSERIRTAARRETIDIAVLAKRDNWRCHLCRRKVTRDTWSHDHLIPLSDGGDHTYANVALAHRACNTQRGTGGTAQLRLAA